MGRAFLALAVLLGLAAAGPARACSVGRDYVRPSNFELVQIAVGLYQARNGLPPLAVGVHMVLAALTAATMTVLVLQLKRPVSTDAAASDAPIAAAAC